MESQQSGVMKIPTATVAPIQKHTIRIGRPGYKVRMSSSFALLFPLPLAGDQISRSCNTSTIFNF